MRIKVNIKPFGRKINASTSPQEDKSQHKPSSRVGKLLSRARNEEPVASGPGNENKSDHSPSR